MPRVVGSVGLSAICGRMAMPLMIAGALGLLGVALASPALPQVPLLTNPDASAPESHSPISVMIVGDSITQGAEGDWTWRYRLWEWFRDQNVKVDFVGPWEGTQPMDIYHPPTDDSMYCSPPPPDPNPSGQKMTGGYAIGVDPDFDSHHFSAWGRQLLQDCDLIRDMVAKYQPDYLLVLLGFNDMGWFVSDADGTFESMKTFISEARAAKPDIKMALGNVPHRKYIPCRDDLPRETSKYNKMLEIAIPFWSTTKSQIELVRMQELYGCDLDSCPAGYDGLHPNALGEYQIAQAFSRTLVNDFSIGTSDLVVPEEIPAREMSTPENLRGVSTATGIAVDWDFVYGVHGYDLEYILVGDEVWSSLGLGSNHWETSWVAEGWEYKFKIRSGYGETKSPWSETISVVYSRPKLPAASG